MQLARKVERIYKKLTYNKIFLFWVPLALTWLMMAVEQPFLIAIIARLEEPKFNLAAFGIAYSFALIIEAPVIMLMSASTALVKDKQAYLKLRRFSDFLNLGVSLVLILILIPPVFNLIVRDMMGVPENVARLTYFSLIILLPWAASIGYRRFYQGILIRNNLTRRVTHGTIVRLSAMGVIALILYKFGIPGAYVGAAAGSLGVICEAIAIRLMANKTVLSILAEPDPVPDLQTAPENNPGQVDKPEPPLTFRSISKFYTPLALTSILSLGVHPFVTFFLVKSYMAIESLAVLPVISSLVFIFRSMGLSYQEVNIALIGDRKENYRKLRNFAIMLGAGVTAALLLIAFTPLAGIWFRKVSGLTQELTDLSFTPLKILVLLPALSVLLSFQRSTLVVAKNTRPISTATAIELLTIIVVLLITIVCMNLIGVIAAALAFMIGKAAANLFLTPRQIKASHSWTHTKN